MAGNDSPCYSFNMSSDPHKLLADALRLPVDARAALAGSLIESLDEEVDDDSEVLWAAEIRRRTAEIDSGEATAIPWTEARRMILGGDGSQVT